MAQLDELIQQSLDLRNEYKALDKQSEEIKERFKDVKYQIIKKCNEMGVDSASKKGVANVSIVVKKHASVQDWDALIEYMKANDAWYLFQKRIATKAYQETLELDGVEDLPGCATFEQEDVNIRVI